MAWPGEFNEVTRSVRLTPALLAAAAEVEQDSSCKVHSSVTVSNRVLRSSWGMEDSSSGTAERHGHVAAIEYVVAPRASVSNSASLIDGAPGPHWTPRCMRPCHMQASVHSSIYPFTETRRRSRLALLPAYINCCVTRVSFRDDGAVAWPPLVHRSISPFPEHLARASELPTSWPARTLSL